MLLLCKYVHAYTFKRNLLAGNNIQEKNIKMRGANER